MSYCAPIKPNVISPSMKMSDTDNEQQKKALIRGFCELDRRGVIEHDWSEVNETGLVKTRVKWEEVEPDGHA